MVTALPMDRWYAPMTLPGEIVTGTVNGTDLSDIRIVTPSSDRVAAAVLAL